jgi:hypothetical protein
LWLEISDEEGEKVSREYGSQITRRVKNTPALHYNNPARLSLRPEKAEDAVSGCWYDLTLILYLDFDI